MPKFKVRVSETLTYESEIEAETKEAAKEIAVTEHYLDAPGEDGENRWAQVENDSVVDSIEELPEEEEQGEDNDKEHKLAGDAEAEEDEAPATQEEED